MWRGLLWCWDSLESSIAPRPPGLSLGDSHPSIPSLPRNLILRGIPATGHSHGAPGCVRGQKSPWNAGKGWERGFYPASHTFQGRSNSRLIPGSSFVIGSTELVPMFSFISASLPISKDIPFIPPFPLSSSSPFPFPFFFPNSPQTGWCQNSQRLPAKISSPPQGCDLIRGMNF